MIKLLNTISFLLYGKLTSSKDENSFWHFWPPRWLFPPWIIWESKQCKLLTLMNDILIKKKRVNIWISFCIIGGIVRECSREFVWVSMCIHMYRNVKCILVQYMCRSVYMYAYAYYVYIHKCDWSRTCLYFSEVSTRALGNRFARLSVIVCMYANPYLFK